MNFTEKEKHHIHPHHMNKMLIIVILLVLLLIILLTPCIKYSLSYLKLKQLGSTPEEIISSSELLKTELNLVKGNLSACEKISKTLILENQNFKQKFSDLENNYSKLKADLAYKDQEFISKFKKLNLSYEEKLKSNSLIVSQTKSSFDELTEKYLSLVKNSAKNICCKQRVDDSLINSYDVLNNKIICSSEGDFKLDC